MIKNKKIISGIYCANAIDYMSKMSPSCIDLTVTSPPYDNLRNYNGYDFDFNKLAKGLFRIMKKGGVVVWVVSDKINGGRTLTSFEQGLYFKKIGFSMHDLMIYKKKNTPFMRSNAYTNCYEFMFILSKGTPKTFHPLTQKTVRCGVEMVVSNKGPDAINRKVPVELKNEKTRTNIWEYAVGLGGTTNDRFAFKHPAIFPEKLAEDHILSWSNKNDIVLDPMCGSGTTCKLAKLHDRRFIGIDISKEYCAIAKKRIKGITAQ